MPGQFAGSRFSQARKPELQNEAIEQRQRRESLALCISSHLQRYASHFPPSTGLERSEEKTAEVSSHSIEA
jgi:hypothetical protein